MKEKSEALFLHEKWGGKIEIISRVNLESREDLSLAYTPGVAEACKEILNDGEKSFSLTRRNNLCAVITNGTAVLGLGDIGPLASMPVMEGKCVLFKTFADIDAFPICVNTKDVAEFVKVVHLISLSFGAINLEDIKAPECFEIEEKLKKLCSVPVFHDDQHGTAVVMLAGLLNALKLVNKKKENVKIVISGAGAAGISVTKLLLSEGFKNIILSDSNGAIYKGRGRLNKVKEEISSLTNLDKEKGDLPALLKGSDIFIGLSAPNILTSTMVRSMKKDSIIFACANPTPEIFPKDAKEAGAKVVATGRSDFPNQINNVLAFPGIFRGVFDAGAREINEGMKKAASYAISALVSENELSADYIIPEPLDKRVVPAVAKAVSRAAGIS